MASDKLDYEALEEMYKSASVSNVHPDFAYTNEVGARAMFGDVKVNEWIVEGLDPKLPIIISKDWVRNG